MRGAARPSSTASASCSRPARSRRWSGPAARARRRSRDRSRAWPIRRTGTVTCGGVDLRHVDPRAWRAQVAWVPQRCTLFAGTRRGQRPAGAAGCAGDRRRAGPARGGRRGPRGRAARRWAHAHRRRRAAPVRRPVAAHRAGARLSRRRAARRARRAHGAPGPRVGGGDRGRDRAPGRTVARCCSSPIAPSWPRAATAVVELRDGRVVASAGRAAEVAA